MWDLIVHRGQNCERVHNYRSHIHETCLLVYGQDPEMLIKPLAFRFAMHCDIKYRV